jgi:hypothetical protein
VLGAQGGERGLDGVVEVSAMTWSAGWDAEPGEAFTRRSIKDSAARVGEYSGLRKPIATVFAGPMVGPGTYATRIDHYSILRTIQDMYGLAALGHSAETTAITGVWRTTAAPTS